MKIWNSTSITTLSTALLLVLGNGCDDGSGTGGSGSTGGDTDPTTNPTSGPEPTTDPDPTIDPGTTTVEPDTSTGDPGSSTSDPTIDPSTSTGEPEDCVDEDIGGSIGEAVVSGSTDDAGDDYSLNSCSGASTSTSTDGGATSIGVTSDGSATSGGTDGGDTEGGSGGPAGDGDDYVVAWTPRTAGEYTITTEGSAIDTVVSVTPPECGADALECNDDCNGLQSSLVYSAEAGETVHIVVEGYDGRTGDFVLSIFEGDTAECEVESTSSTGVGTTTPGTAGSSAG